MKPEEVIEILKNARNEAYICLYKDCIDENCKHDKALSFAIDIIKRAKDIEARKLQGGRL